MPADLSSWHHRIAVLSGDLTSGHLLVEAVTCFGHGDEPVAELQWTARLKNGYLRDEQADEPRWCRSTGHASQRSCTTSRLPTSATTCSGRAEPRSSETTSSGT